MWFRQCGQCSQYIRAARRVVACKRQGYTIRTSATNFVWVTLVRILVRMARTTICLRCALEETEQRLGELLVGELGLGQLLDHGSLKCQAQGVGVCGLAQRDALAQGGHSIGGNAVHHL